MDPSPRANLAFALSHLRVTKFRRKIRRPNQIRPFHIISGNDALLNLSGKKTRASAILFSGKPVVLLLILLILSKSFRFPLISVNPVDDRPSRLSLTCR